MKRVFIETFGCQMNKLDSELSLGLLLDSGYEVAKDAEEADVRNKLTVPLTILNSFMAGKKVSRKSVEIAIRELEEILKLMRGM